MTYAGLKRQMESLAVWGRYHRQVSLLPPDQRRPLIEVGAAIKRSFQLGRAAVRAVQIEGHADDDTPRNLQCERQVSVERDEAATTWGLGATRLESRDRRSPTAAI
jgi:hypothetical protein